VSQVKKKMPIQLVLLVFTAVFATVMLSACNKEARLPTVYTYDPGPAFESNINDENMRRVLKCAIIFEVIDDKASAELEEHNSTIRNSILVVLGGLTLEELTTGKDLNEISQRIVNQVNEAVGSRVNLILGAYFTEFKLS
jgi:flagellar basal body-associated protein FliL